MIEVVSEDEVLDREDDIEYIDDTDVSVTEIFPAFEDYLQPAPFKVARGGRGSAKTRTFCSILLNNVRFFGWRLACFREIMKSLEDSVYQEFIDEIDRLEINHEFKVIKNTITHKYSGGKIKFDGLFRNQQKLKGYAGYDAFWVEEAENVSDESWQFLIPTLRKDDSEIWVSYNPLDPLSATHTMFVTEREQRFPDFIDGKRYCISKEINYVDNPRFPEKLRVDMELMKENDYQLYLHVYMGQPVGNSDLAVINPLWINACVDAHLHPLLKHIDFTEGGRNAGFDVADEGKDKNSFISRKGCLVDIAEEWKDNDPNTAARRVFENSLELGVDLVHFDNIGVGAGAKGAIREEKERVALKPNAHKIRVPLFNGFAANAEVMNPEGYYMPDKLNKDMFRDLKAQAWWLLRDRFKNTYDAMQGKPFDKEKLISISSQCTFYTKLCAELGQPHRDIMNGKVFVESKKDMAKRGVKSPNLADGCVMAFAPESGFKLKNLI